MKESEQQTFIDHQQSEIQRLNLSYNMLSKTTEIKRKQTSILETEKNKVKAEISKFKKIIENKDSQIK